MIQSRFFRAGGKNYDPQQQESESRPQKSRRRISIRKPTWSRRKQTKKKIKVWPTDITDMFGENSEETPSYFRKEKIVQKEPLTERIFEEDFNIDEFMAKEIDELTSPKLEIPKKTSKRKTKRRKNTNSFSLFPRTMLSSNNILKKSNKVFPTDFPLNDDEYKANSYMLPSEDTYKSYDIPHHAKKRFSDFGSLVGYGRNRRQGPPSRGGSRSNRAPEKKRPLRPPPVPRYPSKPLAGSPVKKPSSQWASHKVSCISLEMIILMF